MTKHSEDNIRKNQSKENSKEKKPTEETLADKAAKMFGWKKGKLPKDWTRTFFRK